jgi:hypothetical protein
MVADFGHQLITIEWSVVEHSSRSDVRLSHKIVGWSR